MANVKITDLAAYTNPDSTDVLPIVDVGADVTKKVSIADLLENAGSGTESAPGIAFDGDSDTGIYRPGADQLAISTNGTGRLFIDENGNVGIKASDPEARLHIRGTTTAGGIKIVNSSASASAPGIEVIGKRSDGNDFPAFAGKLLLAKNRTDDAIGSTSTLGSIAFGGNHTNGTEANILYAASIYGQADGVFSSDTNMPTALVFNTGATGRDPDTANVNVGTERLRLDSSGRLLVGMSSQSGGSLLQVNDDRIRIASSKTPASASDTGAAGEVCWDSSYIYVAVGTNTWKRAALSTW